MPPNKRKSKEKEKEKEKETESEKDAVEDVEMEEGDEDEERGIRIGDIYLPPPPLPACTFDSTGPRLVITHIENFFFKSYAGKQVLGPFHKSFTSIVGPNGSGKSNVIDSMLFVFGYRAQKIRSKKISVLIHNSEKHQNVQSCTVAVYFQKIIDKDEEDFEVVPNSQFVVSRTAFRDNTSFYQMDGKRCQFKAVSKELRAYGIDLDHNRFLILQGEVEQIATMKPKALTDHDTGMLEFLEDIVGSSRFKEPIELLCKRVEDLNEARGEKLNRVKLVEKEKDELEGPKDTAIEHLRLENEVTRKRHTLLQRYYLDCSRAKEKAEEKKKEIDDGMSGVKKKLEDLNEKKKEKEEGIKSLGKRLEKISKVKEECSEKFKGLESEDVKMQEDLKHKNQKRKKLMSQLITEKKKLEELEEIPEKNEKDIEECQKQRESLEEKRKKEEAVYHKAMSSLNSETQLLQDEKTKFETKLVDLRKVVDEAKSGVDIAQSELDIYQSTEQNEKNKLEQVLASLEQAQNTISTRKGEIKNLEASIPRCDKQLKEDMQKHQCLIPEQQKVEELLRTHRVKLEETRSAMQSSRSQGRVMDAIMEQKQNGSIPGVFGRLGDLGGIDEKYDVAISTACGPLDNIVVDSVETGQKCISFLKRNNVGTATFIALDKMQKWKSQCERQMQTPENVPRLFDLVRMKDDIVKTAFYFALRDTLVADNLDQASRIAYGGVRHRVVTLKGELIEPSGTMSGGGRSVLRGRMGKQATVVNVDPREMEHIESKVDELTQRAGQLRRDRADLELSIRQLTKDLNSMNMDVQKFKMEFEAAQQQIVSFQEQKLYQEEKVKSVKSDPAKINKLEKCIDGKVKIYHEASASAQEVEAEVNKIHEQIMEITGRRMKGLKNSLDSVNKGLEKFTAEITRLQVAIKTAQRNTKKTREKITGMETEITEVQNELRGMQGKRSVIEEEAAKVLEQLQSVTHEELELGEKVGELKAEHEVYVRKENKIKSSKIEIDQELDRYEGIIKENKAKMSHWKKQLNRLELTDIPINKGEEDEAELAVLGPEVLDELDPKQLQYQLTILEEKLAQSKPNLAVVHEYRKKEEIYLQRVAELDEISRQRDEQRKYHEDLRKQRLNEFMAGFTIISNKLKEMYQMITLGGDAELELVDSLDPFSEGIVFSVRPPKKSWKNITNLSGGEKTLSSLALVFALHYFKPTPLYVMDEIDAALDFKNVSIVGNYIKERTKNAQFIIISLRSQMFELADRLVGIYKTYNATKSVTINPAKIVLNNSAQTSDKANATMNQTLTAPPILAESRV
ncbi:structural maintenance of chromosomes protein 4-like [Homarus americanus]|uniref:structural maintenance of chromosomes protein 4-like n=1 Tax=Homarus americanus TaxID=6706 RepID=UPI001C487662|nr:structural maintenance of chromosomes protein 4-like [Homarus americanus]